MVLLHCLLACKVSAEKSVGGLTGASLYEKRFLPLDALKIVFDFRFITLCLEEHHLGLKFWDEVY